MVLRSLVRFLSSHYQAHETVPKMVIAWRRFGRFHVRSHVVRAPMRRCIVVPVPSLCYVLCPSSLIQYIGINFYIRPQLKMIQKPKVLSQRDKWLSCCFFIWDHVDVAPLEFTKYNSRFCFVLLRSWLILQGWSKHTFVKNSISVCIPFPTNSTCQCYCECFIHTRGVTGKQISNIKSFNFDKD